MSYSESGFNIDSVQIFRPVLLFFKWNMLSIPSFWGSLKLFRCHFPITLMSGRGANGTSFRRPETLAGNSDLMKKASQESLAFSSRETTCQLWKIAFSFCAVRHWSIWDRQALSVLPSCGVLGKGIIHADSWLSQRAGLTFSPCLVQAPEWPTLSRQTRLRRMLHTLTCHSRIPRDGPLSLAGVPKRNLSNWASPNTACYFILLLLSWPHAFLSINPSSQAFCCAVQSHDEYTFCSEPVVHLLF